MTLPALVPAVASMLAAAVLAAAGPRVVARLPEPEDLEPDDLGPKPPYAELARRPALAGRLALAAAVLAAVAAVGLHDRAALLPAWVLFAVVGSWLAFIDWHTRLLPYALTRQLHLGALALVALAAVLERDPWTLGHALIGNVVVFAIFLLVHLVGHRIGQPFGYGDVRLAGVIGLLLGAVGAQATLYGVYAGFVLGAVVGLLLARLRLIDPRAYAFGPYLVAGAAAGLALSGVI